MEYTVEKLARLAGITARTLRYYDQVGILKPMRKNSSGYRIYGRAEVDRLQQILFYRELGVSLEGIKDLITAPTFDEAKALHEHRRKLLEKKSQLDILIANVEQTIALTEGKMKMTDKEKFAGFKQKMIDGNEAKYGQEIRAQYGDIQVDGANKKLKNMTQEQYDAVEKLAVQIMEVLNAAMQLGDPASDMAQQAADLHRQWLSFYWPSYSKEAHAGLAKMYVDDPRFTAHYDQKNPGTAIFLREAILIYTGRNNL